MEYSTISTETWKLVIPNDWAEVPDDSRTQLYFEAKDGTKGTYIHTWNFEGDTRSAKEILASIREKEISSLHRMDGRTWTIVQEDVCEKTSQVRWTIDALDKENAYRIVSVLIGDLPWVVRSSFHDYDCSDFGASTNFLAPIIGSLELHNDQT